MLDFAILDFAILDFLITNFAISIFVADCFALLALVVDFDARDIVSRIEKQNDRKDFEIREIIKDFDIKLKYIF